MNIIELGAIGELVGGVAVIGSLIYVGLEVHQSNQLNRAEAVRSFVRDYGALLRNLGDPQLVDVFRKGMFDFEGLSKAEKTRIHVWLLQNFWISFTNDFVDPRRRNPFTEISDWISTSTFSTPGFSQWWAAAKAALGEASTREYVDHVDRQIQALDEARMARDSSSPSCSSKFLLALRRSGPVTGSDMGAKTWA
jgi:hypothetical protein